MSATVSFEVACAQGEQTVTLSYTRKGTGAPLVLLHGIGHHRQVWDPVIPALAAERDVIAVDLPGCGESLALPEGMAHDLPTMNTVLAALFEALDLERPHVAGNSLGGLLALDLARARLVRSVTALSPGGFWNAAERRYAFAVLMTMRQIAQRMPRPVVERLARPAIGRTLMTSTVYARPGRRSPEAVVAETLALANAQGFFETLRSGRTVQFSDDIVGMPVTVAWGNRDRLLIPRQGVRAKGVIPGARLVRLPGCGHVPMNDDPALVARVLLDGSR
ncbi:alpha/beta fold hydrolase [Streptomyces djakartensis]|uniref:Hydrolase n=1 Tax=Streptomyces djakartensis TaxID=68193 RepID=A0ABQ3A488_9ACTN|nr:alpha/beta fold hydrolase [Streptomyces djakartensis]GGY31405.1 hydrolase [Streptomyces djakartensis]